MTDTHDPEVARLSALDAALADLKLSGEPLGLILAEDPVGVAETRAHLGDIGVAEVLVVGRGGGRRDVAADLRGPRDAAAVLNRVLMAVPGRWVLHCYNAEFPMFPFFETRALGDLCDFLESERRSAAFALTLDLVPEDPRAAVWQVERAGAVYDAVGYFAFSPDGTAEVAEVEGGLRWRLAEHVPEAERRLDRVAVLRGGAEALVGPDLRPMSAELRTTGAPWHRSPTLCVASFRAARALAMNPGSRSDMRRFVAPRAAAFGWTSAELMAAGMMEPGQWF